MRILLQYKEFFTDLEKVIEFERQGKMRMDITMLSHAIATTYKVKDLDKILSQMESMFKMVKEAFPSTHVDLQELMKEVKGLLMSIQKIGDCFLFKKDS